jgi:hypothetical protein
MYFARGGRKPDYKSITPQMVDPAGAAARIWVFPNFNNCARFGARAHGETDRRRDQRRKMLPKHLRYQLNVILWTEASV